VGFSPNHDDSFAPVVTLAQASPDFQTFLARFTARFPDYFRKGLYMAGESFGGRYTPRFTADIIRKQKSKLAASAASNDVLQAAVSDLEVKGVVLVDPYIDGAYTNLGFYEMFCTDTNPASRILRFNASACADIAAASIELERLDRLCHATWEPMVCAAANDYGKTHIFKYYQEEVDARRHSPYDGKCIIAPLSSDQF